MNRIETKYPGVFAYMMGPWEYVPRELMTPENNGSYFIYRDKVLKYKWNAFRSILVPCKEYSVDAWTKKFLKDPQDYTKTYADDTHYLQDHIFENMSFNQQDFLYVMAYFRKIYELYNSECAVVLMAHAERKQFKPLFVLQYDLSGGHVKYIRPTAISGSEKGEEEILTKYADKHAKVREEYNRLVDEGWILYGTMHSHCNMDAFHSSVDDGDEFKSEGLHITLGKVGKGNNFDIAYRFIIEGADFGNELVSLSQLIGVDQISELVPLVDDIIVSQEHIDLAIYEPPVIIQSHIFHGQSDKQYADSWEEYLTARWGNKIASDLSANEEPIMVRNARKLLESVEENTKRELSDAIFNLDDIILVEHPGVPGRIAGVYAPIFDDIEDDVPFVPLEEVVDFKSIRKYTMKKINKIKKG